MALLEVLLVICIVSAEEGKLMVGAVQFLWFMVSSGPAHELIDTGRNHHGDCHILQG
jgi:hypothetical protein